METAELKDRAIDAATKLIAEHGFDAFSLERLAADQGWSVAKLHELYSDDGALLRSLASRSMERVADRLSAAVERATDGAEALGAYVETFVRHFLERIDEFRQVMMLRQIVGSARFGFDRESLNALIFPAVSRSLDLLEDKLSQDGVRYELPGGLHPRRLAFAALVTGTGFVTLRGLSASEGNTMIHGDDDMIRDTSRALGATLSSLRQLSALNEATGALARLRSETQLVAAAPQILASVIELSEAALVVLSPDEEQNQQDEEIRRALIERRTVHDTGGRRIVTPVLYEGEPGAVLCASRSSMGSSGFDEREIARFETFASMVGLALENVRLYDDLQAQIRARTKKLHETHVRLVEAEKMAALGKLVAGLVHELNTPVGSLLGSSGTLGKAANALRAQAQGPDSERPLRALEQSAIAIDMGARRVTEIVARLKRFSRLDAAEIELADISEGLEDAVEILRPELPRGAEIELRVGELPRIWCRADRLNQVFLNVIRNAVQAIRASGRVRVASSVGKEGQIVVLVEDDGVGIASEDLSRVFEPGFSAKGQTVRAGLGLATAYQVVRDHGGSINLESTPGRGTRVMIELPIGSPSRGGRTS